MWALVGPPVLTACPSWNWEELELQGCWSSSGLLRRVGTGRGGLSLPGSLSLSAPLPSPPPGVSSNVVPMYLGELAPKNLRGALGVVPQLFITIGILVAQLFGLRSILANQKGEYGLPETELLPGPLLPLGHDASGAQVAFCLVEWLFWGLRCGQGPRGRHALGTQQAGAEVSLLGEE